MLDFTVGAAVRRPGSVRMAATTIRNARVVTLRGAKGPRRGGALRDLGVIERGWVSVLDGRITGVGEDEPPELTGEVIDARGRALLPALVDCHTHLLHAGSRDEEWALKWAGTPYLEIVRRGGGILSTVRAVRETPDDVLDQLLARRIERCTRLGTGAIEVKTGYGLDVEHEMRMLESILRVAGRCDRPIVATFLGGHAHDPDRPNLVEAIISEGLPRLAKRLPGAAVDAFCEESAWTLDDCRRYLTRAKELGLALRLHADQFNALGGVELAVELGALSVDHLEASGESQLRRLAESRTFGVMLPCCGFALDGRYAKARRFVDLGGALALASNANPGSAPSLSLAFSIALSVRFMGLSVREAITAAIWNPACLLGLEHEIGSIEPGKRADLILLDGTEGSLAFDVAGPGPAHVWIAGVIDPWTRRTLP